MTCEIVTQNTGSDLEKSQQLNIANDGLQKLLNDIQQFKNINWNR